MKKRIVAFGLFLVINSSLALAVSNEPGPPKPQGSQAAVSTQQTTQTSQTSQTSQTEKNVKPTVAAAKSNPLVAQEMTVTIDKLRVRSNAKIADNIIEYLKKGEVVGVEISGKSAEWCKVDYVVRKPKKFYKNAYASCQYLSYNFSTNYNSLLAQLNKISNGDFLKQKFGDGFDSTVYIPNMSWIGADGTAVFIKDIVASQAKIEFTDQNNFNSLLAAYVDLVDKVMISNGFDLNLKNSSDNKGLNDKKFLDGRHSYQNKTAGVVCTLRLNSDETLDMMKLAKKKNNLFYFSKTVTFVCSNKVQNAYQEQAPFYAAIKEKSLDAKSIIGVNVKKKDGDFYYVDIYFERGGQFAILKKNGNGYSVIYIGQDYPSCVVVNNAKVPLSIYGECLK